ncbi:RNA-dependent RNA polymerase, partial [viral metagenome]
MGEEAIVDLQGLPEALKIRTISKGPAITYFVLRPVQKFLHNTMRKHRIFTLLGHPEVTPELLAHVFPRSADETEKGDKFHSLDYEAATDNLSPLMSETCVDAISDCIGLPLDLRKLFHKALTGHRINDPTFDHEEFTRLCIDAELALSHEERMRLWTEEQKMGQLMGSIVSFPVLCIVNAAVCRRAFELTTGVVCHLDQFPCLINGDDGLVLAPTYFETIWEDIARSVGLTPSVGKCYVHDFFLNINSTSFYCLPSPGEPTEFSKIPYVNIGLVNGMKRSGGKQTVSDMFSIERGLTIGAAHRELMSSCPQSLRLKVHECFLASNWAVLDSVAIPWYIPEELGGVGLEPTVDYVRLSDDVDDMVPRDYARLENGHRCGPSPLDVRLAWALEDRNFSQFRVSRV